MKLKNLTLLAALSALGIAVAAGPAAAGKDDDSLIIAWGSTGPIEHVDNYVNTNRTGIWFSRMVWDQLIYREPKTFEYKPLLAESWEQLSDTVWQFKLRQGVKFHNGEPFDADDVVYTLNWISNPDNGVKVQRNVNWIKEARKVDQYTVDLEMKRPFPQAFEFLSGPITIYPNEYYAEKVGPDGMHKQPDRHRPDEGRVDQDRRRVRDREEPRLHLGQPEGRGAGLEDRRARNRRRADPDRRVVGRRYRHHGRHLGRPRRSDQAACRASSRAAGRHDADWLSRL